MKEILDWILITLTTYIFVKSIIYIVKRKSGMIEFCIIIFYVFNCLPILLDYMIGMPVYNSWFYNLERAMENRDVGIIYDIYMIIVAIVFLLYQVVSSSKSKKIENMSNVNNKVILDKKCKYLLIFLSVLPHLYIILTGNLKNFFTYESLSARNLGEMSINLINIFNQISIVSFFYLYFYVSNFKNSKIVLVLYIFSICWIDGKRYIVLTILLMYVFLYMKSYKIKYNYKKFLKYIVVIFCIFAIFYSIYAKNKMENVYKVSNDKISFYTDFRINFGRDDVVKFVIMREFIENNPILEYRGESVLSSIGMLVPRAIWNNKPYPHYRYLSAAIYNTNISNIPSGMTPSVFEMGIANFSYLGILITPIIMIALCFFGDRRKSIMEQSIYLIILSNLLTQSLDAAMGFIIILIIMFFYKVATKKGKGNETNISKNM